MKNLTLPIVIEADKDGFFVSCPTLQGCYSQGDTYEEAVENIKVLSSYTLLTASPTARRFPRFP